MSEWIEYQGFRTKNVPYEWTDEDHILTEDEVKEAAVSMLGETMNCEGIRWDVNFYEDDADPMLAEPVASVMIWTYPEDL